MEFVLRGVCQWASLGMNEEGGLVKLRACSSRRSVEFVLRGVCQLASFGMKEEGLVKLRACSS